MAYIAWRLSDDHIVEMSLFGYIRRIETKYTHLNIPMGIKLICLDYYEINDFFAIYGDKIKVNNKRNIAQGTSRKGRLNTIYTNEIIDFSNDDITRYNWKFKIWHPDKARKFKIGICNHHKLTHGNKGKLSHKFKRITSKDAFQDKTLMVGEQYPAIFEITIYPKAGLHDDKEYVIDLYRNGGWCDGFRLKANGEKYNVGFIISDDKPKVELVHFVEELDLTGVERDDEFDESQETMGQIVGRYISDGFDFFKSLKERYI